VSSTLPWAPFVRSRRTECGVEDDNEALNEDGSGECLQPILVDGYGLYLQRFTDFDTARYCLLGAFCQERDSDTTRGVVALEDPATGAVTTLALSPSAPRAWHTATLLPDGTVLIVGGINAQGHTISASASSS
jgi:hypothetical protein